MVSETSRDRQSCELRRLFADLHIHTALSPCGGDEMTPPAIVAAAVARGLDMIAICDHNSARNAAAVREAAGDRLAVVPGMEVTTAEEVHVVGLFPSVEAALAASDEAGRSLPEVTPDYTTFFGEQWVLAADGSLLGYETRSLALATALNLESAVALIHAHGGLAVAAHVDRRSFGVIAQLGVFPAAAGFDAIEVSRYAGAQPARLAELREHGLPITSSSDAHYLEDVGAACGVLTAAVPSFAEIAAALAGAGDRGLQPLPGGPAAAEALPASPASSGAAASPASSARPARPASSAAPAQPGDRPASAAAAESRGPADA